MQQKLKECVCVCVGGGGMLIYFLSIRRVLKYDLCRIFIVMKCCRRLSAQNE